MHDQSNVLAILEKLHAIPPSTFTQARPFPHVVIDNIFPDQLLSDIHNVLPISADEYWDKSDEAGIEVKWRSRWISEYDIPQPARELVRFLNSGAILRELSRLTGVDHLISDPYYSGGGFNLIRRGGHLDVHVDGNWHDIMQVNRRLNLILYLNPEWKETWGGHLHFYDSAANQPEVSVLPKSNRLLIFETTDYSYHGHPEPLQCPEHEARTSIILYYYTAGARPKDQVTVADPHSALWRSKGWLDKRGRRTRAVS